MKHLREDPYAKKDRPGVILAILAGAWVAGFSILYLGLHMGSEFVSSLGHVVIMTATIWLACRAYVQFLWRRFPWDSHPVIHIVLEVIGIGMLAFLIGLGIYYLEIALGVTSAIPVDDVVVGAIITLLVTYLITGIHEMIYFYRQWIMNFSKSIRLERDSIEAKYETLKTQVNPHFLFNSLNSLTAMVDNNPRAVSHIQNLSEFLRYMLSSRDKDLVYLRDELKVLEHYLELQKSRFADKLSVEIKVDDKYLLYALPPLALQMMVENCIKHNVISAEYPLSIRIETSEDRITIRNNLQKKTGVESTGQGLKNIIERYSFFTQRDVEILESDREYAISVPLLIIEI